ncbi:hypothetical protein [Thalassotalea castellviae]|uniref:Uncharacterized protein n=1 Tax=Thalassotalea castellviae TaxID=3075612 RepID=A0ABU2ZVN9_9GAMM|nr:hypothetical protein [Thalassotalea sp. W431]MDT0602006.1 hypothetical protein [Thalassotalea sp. W431]
MPGERITAAENRCTEIQQEMSSEAIRNIFSPVPPVAAGTVEQSSEESPEF